MKLKDNEIITECSEFDNYYVFFVQDKKDSKKFLMPDSGRTIAISKKNNKEYEYFDEESLDKLNLQFGDFIKELDENEIESLINTL